MPVAYKKNAVIDDYQRSILNTWIEPLCGDDVITVSRGHALPIEQLQTISVLAHDNGVVFPEFNPADVYERVTVEYEGKQLEAYAWWRTWGELLHRDVIANPPLAAYVPYDYIVGAENKKGKLIQASPHIVSLSDDPHSRPCPLDLSGRVNRGLTLERVDLSYVADIARQAKLNGAPIRNIKVETKNNCVHLDLEKQA